MPIVFSLFTQLMKQFRLKWENGDKRIIIMLMNLWWIIIHHSTIADMTEDSATSIKDTEYVKQHFGQWL